MAWPLVQPPRRDPAKARLTGFHSSNCGEMRPERGRRTSDGSGDIALDLTSWPYSLPLPAQIRKWYLYKGPFPKPGRVHIYIYIYKCNTCSILHSHSLFLPWSTLSTVATSHSRQHAKAHDTVINGFPTQPGRTRTSPECSEPFHPQRDGLFRPTRPTALDVRV